MWIRKSKGMSPSRRAGSLGSNYGVNSYKQKTPGLSPSYLNKNRLKTPPNRRPGLSSYSPSSSSAIRSSGYGKNNNYSPGHRNYSPGSSLNSKNSSSAVAAYQKRNSPASRINLKNRLASQSPGNRSNNSRNSSPATPNPRLYNPNRGATNRLYSPSGRPRVGQNAFGSKRYNNYVSFNLIC